MRKKTIMQSISTDYNNRDYVTTKYYLILTHTHTHDNHTQKQHFFPRKFTALEKKIYYMLLYFLKFYISPPSRQTAITTTTNPSDAVIISARFLCYIGAS